MNWSTFLQFFLIINVFLIGVVSAIALLHGHEHLKLKRAKAAPPQPSTPSEQSIQLSAAAREQILHKAETDFQAALEKSAAQLHQNLDVTAENLNKLVDHLGTEIIGNELERYRTELSQARDQAKAEIGGITAEVAKYQADLKAKLAEEIVAEKQKLIQEIDTKLADAVGSFLVETLQHNVDLGAQSAYLTAMLEEHKADFIKGVSGESETAG